MRVVGGSARGRTLQAPPGSRTRPTSDRVREAVFSMLASLDALEGASVLDLFSGTGALGIESISRGAERAVLVDRDAAAVACIRRNVEVLGADRDRAVVVHDEALRYLRRAEPFDVVFADPPYAFEHWAELLRALLPRTGLLVAETPDLAGPPAGTRRPGEAGVGGPAEAGRPWEGGPEWETVKVKRYGGTVVSIVQPATPQH